MINYTAPREIINLTTPVNESVGQAEQRVSDYLKIIDLYTSPATRVSVNNHPVINVYRNCQSLAVKGGLEYNGPDTITTTLKICFQLGVTSIIEAAHAHA